MVFVSDAAIRPRLAAGTTLVADGWMLKLTARLVVDGYPEEYIRAIFSDVEPPSLVVLLDPGAARVWERASRSGRRFGAVEMGLYAGYHPLDRDSYIDYQSRVMDVLRRSLSAFPTAVVDVRDDLDVDATCAVVEREVRRHLDQRAAT
jgi:hypothetical protein